MHVYLKETNNRYGVNFCSVTFCGKVKKIPNEQRKQISSIHVYKKYSQNSGIAQMKNDFVICVMNHVLIRSSFDVN